MQKAARSSGHSTFDVIRAVFPPAIQLDAVVVHTLQTRNAVL